ncbi:MAG TPA: hypothetical protein VMZ52_14695 [Bryobacteraceae bacterium]|nr:hypothetical protein [Bryobacteraceae bacterium]
MRSGKNGDFGPWYWALLVAAITVLLIYGQPLVRLRRHAPAALALRSTDLNGRMRVEWDPRQTEVRDAQGATLEVIDGTLTNRYPVDPRVLRSGSFDYLRQSDDVLLTMTVYKDGRPGVEGIIRSVGSPPSGAALAPAPAEATRARVERRPSRHAKRSGSRR